MHSSNFGKNPEVTSLTLRTHAIFCDLLKFSKILYELAGKKKHTRFTEVFGQFIPLFVCAHFPLCFFFSTEFSFVLVFYKKKREKGAQKREVRID